MRFLFAGHSTFGNRGCEALIRSTVGLLKRHDPAASFVVPSSDVARDRRQWPQAESNGVTFVPSPPFPYAIRWWNRAARVLPLVGRSIVPHHRLPEPLRGAVLGADAMIMSGGDVLSLDYGLASLYDWVGWSETAWDLQRPTLLWAASVGPFSKHLHVERLMANHLRGYQSISVRESVTAAYLRGLGLDVAEAADPAFTLEPEPLDASHIWPDDGAGVIGLNVSPLVREYRPTEESRRALDADLMEFMRVVLARTRLSILLLPHVGPLDGSPVNCDHNYLRRLAQTAQLSDERLRLAPPTLNAAQLKYLIGKCRFFIGARTHATIAAFSSAVPTTSIAYSVKAKGINLDLFGHTEHVLDTPAVTADALWAHLERMQRDETAIRACLQQRGPQMRERADIAARHALRGLTQSKEPHA